MALNSRMQDWRGRTVWLVGASTGIGRATASALHAQGAKVVVSARGADALKAFVDAHLGALALPLDVTDAPAVKAAASALAAQDALDCVVYCAGHYHAMDAAHMDLADLLRHNEVNYLGALYLLDAVVPQLLALPNDKPGGQRGHISLMGSVAGYRGLPNSLAYGPTKAALINPGFVETPLTRQNQFKMPALISPEQAAREILKGWARGEFEIHFPKRFTRWMKALRLLPYPLFFAATRRLRKA